MPKIYLSPSTQEYNPYVTGAGSEESFMNLLADAMEPILLLNGIQFGVTLFLMASGLTLVFGIMNFINLAHGSLYMIGAFAAAAIQAATGSFLLGIVAATALAMRRALARLGTPAADLVLVDGLPVEGLAPRHDAVADPSPHGAWRAIATARGDDSPPRNAASRSNGRACLNRGRMTPVEAHLNKSRTPLCTSGATWRR